MPMGAGARTVRRARKFQGTSSRGDIREALDDAIAAAKTGLRSSLVSWKLAEVSGETGGVVAANKLTVVIQARAGPPSAR